MRKLFIIILAIFLGIPAHSAQMVNVEYIHNAIAQKWDITVPYNPALTNPKVAANMKYLLSAVDVANKMLNGPATTYGTSEYATLAAADTVATNDAVARLITRSNITPLESLYFDGQSYIDLGFAATKDLNFEIKAWLDNSVNYRDGPLMGGRANYVNPYLIWYNNIHGSIIMVPLLFKTGESDDDIKLADTPQVIKWENQVFSLNGVTQNIEFFSQSENNINMLLGGLRMGTTIDDRKFLGWIYYAKFWDSNGMIMDLIPALDASGVPCMYDRVSGNCMYNEGSGSFRY